MKSKMNKRAWIAAALIALILTASVGGTLAYLLEQTGEVVNTFQPSKVTSQVVESLSGNAKNNVRIKNTGDVDAYIRAAVVVTWQDAQGNVYPATPVAEEDYIIIWNQQDWFEKDGYYYYTNQVKPGEQTSNLFSSCTPNDTEPADYTLHVEILGSAIQSEGVNEAGKHPVALAWGVTVNNKQTPDDFSDDTISK